MKTFVIAALMALVSADHCCDTCGVTDDKIKTFSIDHIFGECGEACMEEKDFWKYKLFEFGLKKAESGTATPCADAGYALYDKTDTHGVPGFISMTLDMYKPGEPAPQPDAVAPEDELAAMMIM